MWMHPLRWKLIRSVVTSLLRSVFNKILFLQRMRSKSPFSSNWIALNRVIPTRCYIEESTGLHREIENVEHTIVDVR